MKLTIVYTYYDNPHMLERQMQEWETYSAFVKENIEIIVVDDCSALFPIHLIGQFPEGIKGRGYRVTKKVPLNFLACRNIGFHKADTVWVLSLDIDHVISDAELDKVLVSLKALDKSKVYQFCRIDVFSGKELRQHGGCILLTKELFWKMGGYNEVYAGIYQGISGYYHHRFHEVAGEYVILNIQLALYDNKSIKDATNMQFQDIKANVDKKKFKNLVKQNRKFKVLSFPYEEIIV